MLAASCQIRTLQSPGNYLSAQGVPRFTGPAPQDCGEVAAENLKLQNKIKTDH
jgi:hypothetical protein